MKTTEWRPIRDYNYEVSSDGEIRNKENKKIIKQRVNTYGYKIADIQVNKKSKTFVVHRLVAEAFLGVKQKDENQWQVDHLDRDRTNNKVENLRWATRSENLKNRIVTKRKNFEMSIKTIKEIIRLYESGKSPNEIYLLI